MVSQRVNIATRLANISPTRGGEGGGLRFSEKKNRQLFSEKFQKK